MRRPVEEIRAKVRDLGDLRHRLVEQHRYRVAGEVNLKMEALLWAMGSEWNTRWYEVEEDDTAEPVLRTLHGRARSADG